MENTVIMVIVRNKETGNQFELYAREMNTLDIKNMTEEEREQKLKELSGAIVKHIASVMTANEMVKEGICSQESARILYSSKLNYTNEDYQKNLERFQKSNLDSPKENPEHLNQVYQIHTERSNKKEEELRPQLALSVLERPKRRIVVRDRNTKEVLRNRPLFMTFGIDRQLWWSYDKEEKERRIDEGLMSARYQVAISAVRESMIREGLAKASDFEPDFGFAITKKISAEFRKRYNAVMDTLEAELMD